MSGFELRPVADEVRPKLDVALASRCAAFLSSDRCPAVADFTLVSVGVAAGGDGQLGTADFPVALAAVVLISATSVPSQSFAGDASRPSSVG